MVIFSDGMKIIDHFLSFLGVTRETRNAHCAIHCRSRAAHDKSTRMAYCNT